MKKRLMSMVSIIPFLALLFSITMANAQPHSGPMAPAGAFAPEDLFNYTIRNVTQITDRIFEFDVYLLDIDPAQPMQLATVQAGITYNTGILNGGTVSAGMVTIVAGSSELPSNQGFGGANGATSGQIKLASKAPPGAGAGAIISTVSPGTRIARIRFTNTVPFTNWSTPNLLFAPSTGTNPYPSKVALYMVLNGSLNTQVPCIMGDNCFVLENPVLNPYDPGPITYAVTGGGEYCQGTGGLPVGLTASDVGTTYTLYKNSIAQVPTVDGTGLPISFGNQLFGTYTVSGTNMIGTTVMPGSAVIIEVAFVAAGVAIAPGSNNICAGDNVTLTASPVGGGTSPTYQWNVNSNPVGMNSPTYSYVPNSGDVVYVTMTSNSVCATGSPATSNVLTLLVNQRPVPALSGPANVLQYSTGNVYTTEIGMANYSWALSSGGTIIAGGSLSDNTVTITWNTMGPQSVSVNYVNSTSCMAVIPTVFNVAVSENTVNSNFQTTLRNIVQTSDRNLEFDLYILDTDASTPFELAGYQAGILLNPGVYNGGTVTASLIAGSTTLTNANQEPTAVLFDQSVNTIKLASRTPPGSGNGSIISTIVPGSRVVRLVLTNTVPWTANSTPDFFLQPSTTGNPSYPTKVHQYIAGLNTPVPVEMGVNAFVLENPVLNSGIAPPVAYSVTGSGSYCQGGAGLTVGLANSQLGVNYTLFKDGIPTPVIIAGNGSAISFGNQLFGTFTVSGTADGTVPNIIGTTIMTGSAVVTETPRPVPTLIGPSSVSAYSAGNVYTTETGMANYSWSISAGGVITAGGGSANNTITVTWTSAGARYVSVNYDNTPSCNAINATILNVTVVANDESNFNYILQNVVQTSDRTFEFDLYLLDIDPSQPMELATVQAGITYNTGILNGGPVSASMVTIIAGSSELPSTQGFSSANGATSGQIKLASKAPPGTGSGAIISTVFPGTRIARIRFTNTVPFTSNSIPNLFFAPSTGTNPYPSKVSLYLASNGGINTQIPVTMGINAFVYDNPILNANANFTWWTGAFNSDWFNSGNWDNGIPGFMTDAIIPGGLTNYPTLTSATGCQSITINDGGSFIGSEFLTTAYATVRRNIANSKAHFLSSPVGSATFGNVFANSTTVWARKWNPSGNTWVYQTSLNQFAPGAGYNVSTSTPPVTAEFTGSLNTPSTPMPLFSGLSTAFGGWNLLGNPYTSAINWESVVLNNVNPSVAVWDGLYTTTGAYKYYNSVTHIGIPASYTGIIPAENGFFVAATAAGASIQIPGSARLHSLNPFLKESVADVLRLHAEGNNYGDEMLVHFENVATSGFDDYDAKKLGESASIQLYSIAGGDQLSMNTFPLPGNEIVELGFKSDLSGNYTITASDIETLDPVIPVFLEDTKMNTIQNMRSNSVYNFSYETGENAIRFKLHFKSTDYILGKGISIYSKEHIVKVENSTGFEGEAWIYDMTGRELVYSLVGSQMTTDIPVKFAIGTYLVKVVTSKVKVNQKVFIW